MCKTNSFGPVGASLSISLVVILRNGSVPTSKSGLHRKMTHYNNDSILLHNTIVMYDVSLEIRWFVIPEHPVQ